MKPKKIKINTNYHFEYNNSRHEQNSGEVITIPDQSYTIEEILDKFTRGLPLQIGMDAQYSDTDDFDEIDERSQILDLTDITDVIERQMIKENSKKSKGDKTGQVAEHSGDTKPVNSPKDV